MSLPRRVRRPSEREMTELATTEAALYRALGTLTKNREQWEANIPYTASLLSSDSTRIRAKALWLLGEMGLAFPNAVEAYVPAVAAFCGSGEPLLRDRAIHALGRIGRGNFRAIALYWEGLFQFAHDEAASVRLSFIWASENIAVFTPDPYETHMGVFSALLRDPADKVRMEAPEMFRVIGKRRPAFVKPYLALLQTVAETDENRVVRIHCLGAIRAASAE